LKLSSIPGQKTSRFYPNVRPGPASPRQIEKEKKDKECKQKETNAVTVKPEPPDKESQATPPIQGTAARLARKGKSRGSPGGRGH
jgi:hypothetical protein